MDAAGVCFYHEYVSASRLMRRMGFEPAGLKQIILRESVGPSRQIAKRVSISAFVFRLAGFTRSAMHERVVEDRCEALVAEAHFALVQHWPSKWFVYSGE